MSLIFDKDNDIKKYLPLPISENVKYECFNADSGAPDRKICCDAVKQRLNTKTRGIGLENMVAYYDDSDVCSVNKTYVSSPFEKRELEVSRQIQKVGPFTFTETAGVCCGYDDVGSKRFQMLMDHLTNPKTVSSYLTLLKRISTQMRGYEDTPLDHEYLSRFHVVKQCGGEAAEEWDEWIEPLTLSARCVLSSADYCMSTCVR